jgi:uncharacterized membrane protein YgaE (UPF0421/DUF939 family)
MSAISQLGLINGNNQQWRINGGVKRWQWPSKINNGVIVAGENEENINDIEEYRHEENNIRRKQKIEWRRKRKRGESAAAYRCAWRRVA